MDAYNQLLNYLAGPAIVGLITWVFFLQHDLNDFKIQVANTYLKNTAVDDIRADIKELSKVVYEIAGKLGVPIRKE
jgi:hypothetical protein